MAHTLIDYKNLLYRVTKWRECVKKEKKGSN